MRKHISISMAVLAGLLLLALGAEAAPAKPAAPPTALRALDPVALIGGQEVKGDASIYFDYNKFRYVFANQKNRTLFSKEPARYAIQGDGTCPVAPKFQVNPNLFTVYKGKLYAFASVGCMVPFGEDPEKFLAKWPGNPDKKKSAKKN